MALQDRKSYFSANRSNRWPGVSARSRTYPSAGGQVQVQRSSARRAGQSQVSASADIGQRTLTVYTQPKAVTRRTTLKLSDQSITSQSVYALTEQP